MEPAAEESLNQARVDTSELFSKIAALLESELQAGSDDFTLIEQMNLLTSAKYREMVSALVPGRFFCKTPPPPPPPPPPRRDKPRPRRHSTRAGWWPSWTSCARRRSSCSRRWTRSIGCRRPTNTPARTETPLAQVFPLPDLKRTAGAGGSKRGGVGARGRVPGLVHERARGAGPAALDTSFPPALGQDGWARAPPLPARVRLHHDRSAGLHPAERLDGPGDAGAVVLHAISRGRGRRFRGCVPCMPPASARSHSCSAVHAQLKSGAVVQIAQPRCRLLSLCHTGRRQAWGRVMLGGEQNASVLAKPRTQLMP